MTSKKTRLIQSPPPVAERYRVFMEIMEGPNPLTDDEIRKLIEKRPAYYGFLDAFLSNKEN